MKKYFTTSLALATLAACIYFSACKTKKETTVKTSTCTSTYTADVKKILDGSCMPCHSTDKHKHNIDLSSYEGSKEAAGGKNFLGSVRHESGYDAMPAKAAKLDDATIEKLSCWVQNGMPK